MVWRIVKHPPSLIIKHDITRNTHAHNSPSAYAREEAHWWRLRSTRVKMSLHKYFRKETLLLIPRMCGNSSLLAATVQRIVP